jgi:EAL domain-containing protein (putative c-di-GMP-specific phosphodiesterase class I)
MTTLFTSTMAYPALAMTHETPEPQLHLHSQLEMIPLLEQFSAWTSLTVAFAELRYRHPGLGLFEVPVATGPDHDSTCSRHNMGRLGELYFLRASPFSAEEQQQLTRYVTTLQRPLANAVLYHTALRHCDTLTQRLRVSEKSCASLTQIDHDGEQVTLEELIAGGELDHALQSEALSLVYQPKVDLQSGEVRGLEALLRWHHAERGLLSPEQFIPLAERYGLIPSITRWVLNTVLRQCGHWQAQGLLVPIAVNLSGLDLEESNLPDYLAQLLQAWAIPAHFIELEITETAAIGDHQGSLEILKRLSALGVAVAIDDFGIGYSSLQRLKQLPINTIKIDKSFVMEQGRGTHDILFVDTITRLGHQLGMKVVAEGVDSHDSWQRLLATGCDMAQGYHISRPLSGEAITDWLRDSSQHTRPAHCH